MPIVTAKMGSPILFIVEGGVSHGLFGPGQEDNLRLCWRDADWSLVGISGGGMRGFKLWNMVCVRTYFERR